MADVEFESLEHVPPPLAGKKRSRSSNADALEGAATETFAKVDAKDLAEDIDEADAEANAEEADAEEDTEKADAEEDAEKADAEEGAEKADAEEGAEEEDAEDGEDLAEAENSDDDADEQDVQDSDLETVEHNQDDDEKPVKKPKKTAAKKHAKATSKKSKHTQSSSVLDIDITDVDAMVHLLTSADAPDPAEKECALSEAAELAKEAAMCVPTEQDEGFIVDSDEEEEVDSDASSDDDNIHDSDDLELTQVQSKQDLAFVRDEEEDDAYVKRQAQLAEREAARVAAEATKITEGLKCDVIGGRCLRSRASIAKPFNIWETANVKKTVLKLHADVAEWQRQLAHWAQEGVYEPPPELRESLLARKGEPSAAAVAAEYERGCVERGEQSTEKKKVAQLAVMRSWAKAGWTSHLLTAPAATGDSSTSPATFESPDAEAAAKGGWTREVVLREYLKSCKDQRLNPYTLLSLDEESSDADEDEDEEEDEDEDEEEEEEEEDKEDEEEDEDTDESEDAEDN